MGFASHVASAIDNAKLFEEVSVSRTELDNIFESISDMVFFTDKDYVIRKINNAVIKRTKKNAEEIIGKKCFSVLHGINEPFDNCPHHASISEKKPFVKEIWDPYLKGTFLSSCSPIFDSNKNFLGSVHVVRDISEMKQLRDNLIKAEKELSFMVAHKLGNPIYAIDNYLQTLKIRVERGNTNFTEIIEGMNLSIEKSKQIIHELKQLTKAETITIQKTDILSIIKNSLSIAFQNGVKVKFKGISKLPIVFADPLRISDCFDELTVNSLKWFNKQEKLITITFQYPTRSFPEKLTETKKYIKILFSDNGKGIPQDKKEQVFDHFYTTDKDGSGLGLAVVKRYIEEHNGVIHEIGKHEEGATFEIFLPIEEHGI